jgi:peptidoglycan/xylan/chitin deacetylase (PgdA/CDA1 family)
MYHRVISKAEVGHGLQEGMYVDPTTFDMHVEYLKRNFLIMPLAEIFNNTKASSAKSEDTPVCYLTFDDGWHDFYKYAFPILKAHRIPATVFLPTKYIGSSIFFWTDRIANIFHQMKDMPRVKHTRNSMEDRLAKELESFGGSTQEKIEAAIPILKKQDNERLLNTLSRLEKRWEIKPITDKRSFLNWDEVREMSDTGLISFGSHTDNHRILTELRDDEIYQELYESKKKMISEKAVGTDFIPFSYPNGDHDDRVVTIVKEAGYHVAVTTEKGWNSYDAPMFRLNRISIHQDISSSREMFGCRITDLI